MTAREVLDGIKNRLAAATPGPWELYDCNEGMWPPRPLWSVANNEFHNPSGGEDEPWPAFNAYVETGAKEDAVFIAAAPVDMPRLTRAIEDVLAVHEPVNAVMNPGRYERIVKVCTGCGTDDGNWQRYPCPTVAAIEDALNPKEGQ